MQIFQNWVSDTCGCFSLLDKNVLPLNPLVLHCFQREGGWNYNPASFTAFKDGSKLLYGWEMWLERTLEKNTIKIFRLILKEKSQSQCWLLFGFCSSWFFFGNSLIGVAI